MSEFEDRLQASLGSQYRIERELGGGGMSRVFLAEETALGRKVVLKVLPPELAGVLSPERFQREVRLAASLQHPHIVPLLAAGSADGILYYTMPFVAGESLRARIDRQGALPVAEALRYLRDATDALVAAHAQGIVHRDIKPDNVLLTHQHAVVTDFGIAKALSEAGGQGTLTGTGIAIGTPTYMAPEQAGGEAVDHRADIYSLGVLAFEMLAGEPPFRGPTQALVAAHLTRSAPPLTELRPNLPPGVAQLVARCLEKLPADRYAGARELLADVDNAIAALSSGSGLVTAATRAGSAVRTWPMATLLGWFAVAAAVVLGLAWGLRTLLGLPDWFFPAAVVLLALGLPIVLLAGAAHNRGVAADQPTNRPTDRLTLSKAVKGGIAAFSGLAGVTILYMGMRALGIGPVGSLVASGKLAERERLIIADFSNQTRDQSLGAAVTQAFRVDFAQSRLVSPVEADYVRRVLRRMQKPDSVPLDLSVAREIAERGGFKAVVAGELQQVGPSVLVSAQLVDAKSGEVLATARATAKDSTAILDAVDAVSKKLREKIGESLKSIRASPPLEDVTTGSLDALKLYSQAIAATGAGDNPRAIALLEDAVASDSGFAMAWRRLGTVMINSGVKPERAAFALQRAYDLRDRLTARERRLTEASYYSDVRARNDSSVAALQSLLAEYPEDSWAWNNLGVMNEITGNHAEAEKDYAKAAGLEPENFLTVGNVFSIQVHQAKFDSAAATLRLMKSRFAAGPALDARDAELELGARDYVAAEARLRGLVVKYRSNPAWSDVLQNDLAGVLTLRGKLAEADRVLAALAEARAAKGDSGGALSGNLLRAYGVGTLKDPRAAKALLDAALHAMPIERLPERERPLGVGIQAALAAGDLETAARLSAQFEKTPGDLPGRVWVPIRTELQGMVLAARKESVPQAIASLRRAAGGCSYCVELDRALVFDQAGENDSALVHFQRWAETGESVWEAGVYLPETPLAYFRMGELYQQRGQKGDREKAIDFYGRFSELWREADAELQPKVKEAKRRLGELTAESPRP